MRDTKAVVQVGTPEGAQSGVLIAPNRVLTAPLHAVSAVIHGAASFANAERSTVTVFGAEYALEPRACMVENLKAGFCAVAIARPVPSIVHPLRLPEVDPWPVMPGDKLVLLLPSTRAPTCMERLAGSVGTARLIDVVAASSGAGSLRFEATETLERDARGAPLISHRGEWVGLTTGVDGPAGSAVLLGDVLQKLRKRGQLQDVGGGTTRCPATPVLSGDGKVGMAAAWMTAHAQQVLLALLVAAMGAVLALSVSSLV